jgi:hypothetical protein
MRIQRPPHRVTGNRRDSVKGVGAEFLDIATNDHSRIAHAAMYPDQTKRSSSHFLSAAVAWSSQLGIGIHRLLTNNGPATKAYNSPTSRQLGLQQRRTKPYLAHQRKAERFINKSTINANDLLTHHIYIAD